MIDKEKVLHGLDSCGFNDGIPNICEVTECPYRDNKAYCVHELAHDAGMLISELLKAHEPRVMTLEEVKYSEMPVWLEWNYHFIKPALMHTDQVMTGDCRNAITFLLFGDEEWYTYADDDYGKEIRCWTSRPTDAQREAIPWND